MLFAADMKPRHSSSLILVWRVAEFEARRLNASRIEPTHLLLGLCKVVDLDLPELLSKDSPDRDQVLEELLREVRRVRDVFSQAGFDARRFRRHFRAALGAGSSAQATAGRLHRTDAAKEVFAAAEGFAALANSPVYPVHLLYASLVAEDEKRDEVLAALGTEKKPLQEAAKAEVIPGRGPASPQASDGRRHWN